MERTIKPISSSGRECRLCKYFDTITHIGVAGAQQTICRYESPRSIAMVIGVTPQQDLQGNTSPLPTWAQCTVWPMVSSTDWCGRFTRSPESTN